MNPDDSLMLSILKELRAEMRDQRTMLSQLVEASRRHSRRFDEMERRFGALELRFGDLSGELELMVKGELMARLSHFETDIDEKLARLSDRVQALEDSR